jgi:hypothetical protein
VIFLIFLDLHFQKTRFIVTGGDNKMSSVNPPKFSKKAIVITVFGLILIIVAAVIANTVLTKQTDKVPASAEGVVKQPDKGSVNPSNTTNNNTNQGQVAQATKSEFSSAPYSKVVIDGKEARVSGGELLIDAEGTLFISMNALNKAGKEVSWDKESVFIGMQPVKNNSGQSTGEVADFLSSLKELKFAIPQDRQIDGMQFFKNSFESQPFSLAGTTYEKGIGMFLKWEQVSKRDQVTTPVTLSYNLAGSYKSFVADLGVDDSYKNSQTEYIVRFIADGKNKLERTVIGGELPTPVELDVTGVIKLSIEVSPAVEGDEVLIVLGDARILK